MDSTEAVNPDRANHDHDAPPVLTMEARTRLWMKEREALQAAYRAEQRREFFAEGRDIPDLEFLTPECPICGAGTNLDDGVFICEECEVVWPRNGYGHQAERTHSAAPPAVDPPVMERCGDCRGMGRDPEHNAYGVELVLDCDHIFCSLHGDVGHDRKHGICPICHGAGKVHSAQQGTPT